MTPIQAYLQATEDASKSHVRLSDVLLNEMSLVMGDFAPRNGDARVLGTKASPRTAQSPILAFIRANHGGSATQ
jgi:hypothetical protein